MIELKKEIEYVVHWGVYEPDDGWFYPTVSWGVEGEPLQSQVYYCKQSHESNAEEMAEWIAQERLNMLRKGIKNARCSIIKNIP